MGSDPETLLQRSAYHKPPFVRVFLAHIDELVFNDPRRAVAWARIAPEIARRVPASGDLDGHREHRELLAMSHAVFGGSLRAIGEPDRSAAEYRAAYEIAADGISPIVRADLDSRHAVLRACQDRIPQALAISQNALRVLREGNDEPLLAQALAVHGYILNKDERFDEAMPYFSEALNLSDETRSSRVHHAAVHNLAFSILNNTKNALLSGSFRGFRAEIRQARKRLRPHRDGVPRHKLGWLEGLIWWRLALHSRAIRAFQVARRGFIRLALPYEIALVSLDLTAAHLFCEQHSEAVEIAEEAFEHVSVLETDREAIAVLRLWLEAASRQQLTQRITATTRQMIEARIGPHGCCKSSGRRSGDLGSLG